MLMIKESILILGNRQGIITSRWMHPLRGASGYFRLLTVIAVAKQMIAVSRLTTDVMVSTLFFLLSFRLLIL